MLAKGTEGGISGAIWSLAKKILPAWLVGSIEKINGFNNSIISGVEGTKAHVKDSFEAVRQGDLSSLFQSNATLFGLSKALYYSIFKDKAAEKSE